MVRSLIVLVLIGSLIASACGGDAAETNGPEAAARRGFENWVKTLSVAYREDSYDTVEETEAFATIRVTAEFQSSPNDPWTEQEATVEVIKQGNSWSEPSQFAFGPTQRARQTAESSHNATASVEAVIAAATQQAAEVAKGATATVEAMNQQATETARDATATVQTAAGNATATVRAEQASASATADMHASLDRLYGQMEERERSGDWQGAIEFASDILDMVGEYRDVESRRASYIEQIYQRAMAAYRESNWREALPWLRYLKQVDAEYDDLDEKLGVAESEFKKAPPGIYEVDREIGYDEFVWITASLDRIEVLDDGRIKVVVDYVPSNESQSRRCETDARGNYYEVVSTGSINEGGNTRQLYTLDKPITLIDGSKVVPVDDLCSTSGVFREDFPLIDPLESWVIYPALEDATATFTLTWYPFGSLQVTLVDPLD